MAVAAIRATHGKVYEYGPSTIVIYVASGGADDWTYGALNVTWSYSVELRDTGMSHLHVHVLIFPALMCCSVCSSSGRYGFLLPASEIVPTGEEIFAAVRVMVNYILQRA